MSSMRHRVRALRRGSSPLRVRLRALDGVPAPTGQIRNQRVQKAGVSQAGALMDFANERYVRLYTRDTTGWLLLGFPGRCVYTFLYRKADRSGRISLGGEEPWVVAVVQGQVPEEIAQDGMAACLKRKWIVIDGSDLFFPEYVAANESVTSDAQRAREYRARQRVTKRDDAVTERDDAVTSVTVDVTPRSDRHSVPSRAVPSDPCLTDPEERARARDSDHWDNSIPEPSNTERIRIEFQKRFESATKSIPNQAQLSKACATLLPVLTQTATLRGVSFENALESLLGGFFASQRAKDSGYPPAFLAANPAEYLDASKNGKGREENTWRSRVEASTKKLEQLKAQRQALERSDPNYLSILYDIDKGITEETDRLERRRRELHALTG